MRKLVKKKGKKEKKGGKNGQELHRCSDVESVYVYIVYREIVTINTLLDLQAILRGCLCHRFPNSTFLAIQAITLSNVKAKKNSMDAKPNKSDAFLKFKYIPVDTAISFMFRNFSIKEFLKRCWDIHE